MSCSPGGRLLPERQFHGGLILAEKSASHRKPSSLFFPAFTLACVSDPITSCVSLSTIPSTLPHSLPVSAPTPQLSLLKTRLFSGYERAIHLSLTVDITNAELLQAMPQETVCFLLAGFSSSVHEKAQYVKTAVGMCPVSVKWH